jgi:hypothetical protein
MKKQIIWLRITFIWGIVADAIETIRMIFPNLFLGTTGINLELSDGLRLGLLYGMPVMIGWTLLLFWANLKPIERKGVLICLIPVILAYIVIEIVILKMEYAAFSNMIPTFILQIILIFLCIFSYLSTKKPTQG